MGDSTCISCHRDKASYEETAHRRTSRHPSRATIAGHYTGPGSVLRTPNPALHFRMGVDSAGFHQTAVQGTGSDTTVRTERGSITLPVVIADLPDGVVWLPANSPGSRVRDTLGAGHGDLVGVSA